MQYNMLNIIKYHFKAQINLFGNSAISFSFGNSAIFFSQQVTGLPFLLGLARRPARTTRRTKQVNFSLLTFPTKHKQSYTYMT
jgi:hypothetical protein